MPRATAVLHIRTSYDPAADVWWAESEDVPGLVTEAKTLEALMDRATEIAPTLLATNLLGLDRVTLEFQTSRQLRGA